MMFAGRRVLMSNMLESADLSLLAVISAAVTAYLDQEQTGELAVVSYLRPVAPSGSIWSLSGREQLMERRQQITIRREKRK